MAFGKCKVGIEGYLSQSKNRGLRIRGNRNRGTRGSPVPCRLVEVSVTLLSMKGWVMFLIRLTTAVNLIIVPDLHRMNARLYIFGWPRWCAHYLWWYCPAFIWWRSGTIIRLTAVVRWIRKITQPFIVNIVAETSTTLHGITIYMGLVSQPNIYSLA